MLHRNRCLWPCVAWCRGRCFAVMRSRFPLCCCLCMPLFHEVPSLGEPYYLMISNNGMMAKTRPHSQFNAYCMAVLFKQGFKGHPWNFRVRCNECFANWAIVPMILRKFNRREHLHSMYKRLDVFQHFSGWVVARNEGVLLFAISYDESLFHYHLFYYHL